MEPSSCNEVSLKKNIKSESNEASKSGKVKVEKMTNSNLKQASGKKTERDLKDVKDEITKAISRNKGEVCTELVII